MLIKYYWFILYYIRFNILSKVGYILQQTRNIFVFSIDFT